MREGINKFPLLLEIEIAWGHMDAFQHVNNVMFFRFYESARIAYFEKIGFLKHMEETGIGPILASTSCKYIAPLKYPDTISVGARVTDLRDDRFTMFYRMISHQKDKVVAEGEALVVSYDYNNSEKTSLPQNIVDSIRSLEKNL
jgi:acyl-CoA thioester hydrolase